MCCCSELHCTSAVYSCLSRSVRTVHLRSLQVITFLIAALVFDVCYTIVLHLPHNYYGPTFCLLYLTALLKCCCTAFVMGWYRLHVLYSRVLVLLSIGLWCCVKLTCYLSCMLMPGLLYWYWYEHFTLSLYKKRITGRTHLVSTCLEHAFTVLVFFLHLINRVKFVQTHKFHIPQLLICSNILHNVGNTGGDSSWWHNFCFFLWTEVLR